MIKARIRSEGRDMDDHVEEFIREWMECRPESASLAGFINRDNFCLFIIINFSTGLVRLLRDQHFNDTALKLENGSYKGRR